MLKELNQKMLTIGVILLLIVSCNPPTIEEPVVIYEVSLRFEEAGFGLRSLDYKKPNIDKWVSDVEFASIKDIPKELTCFSNKTWETIISPKLKEASQYYIDYRD